MIFFIFCKCLFNITYKKEVEKSRIYSNQDKISNGVRLSANDYCLLFIYLHSSPCTLRLAPFSIFNLVPSL